MVATRSTTEKQASSSAGVKGAVVVVGRLFYSAIFLASAPMHFTKEVIDKAASQGVPLAEIAVPASGLLAFVGGLSVLLGYRAKWGALALVLFLVPITVMMHAFWAAPDVATMKLQMAMFMKNVSLIGAALLITQFGAGPMSLDASRES
jgi:putative oxidoreductase